MDRVLLHVDIAGLHMKNPVTVGSGCFAAGREYSAFIDLAALGAVTTKGVSLHGWPGNEGIRITETPSGMLNSIGLQNPGVDHLINEDLPWLAAKGATVIVNVAGHSVDEYVKVIERLEDSKAQLDAYEVNISCPNVDEGAMSFGSDPKMAGEVIAACRAVTDKTLIAKLTPNVTDITVIAEAVEEAGADAVSLINSVIGMAIDAKTRRSVLARGVGGLSGPAIKPIALGMVWQCYKAIDIPIIGIGGIRTGIDAVEFLLAGARAVAVGCANFLEPTVTLEVIDGIEQYCIEQGVSDVNELVGALEW
ncbi:MAG: dihydroorotate dehydrogenase [Eggerthellaceae bacterium]|nr:dihydroorotate dehydrogenase [Eggerthellaceae bacterium]